MHLPTFDEREIDALFAQLDQSGLPGAAVGIAIGGRPVYRKGFGLANAELPVLLSPTIRMRIGSTSKHFVALAYLLLCEEGKASIDDHVGKHIPELHPATQRVTLRQLMGHTAGIRDAHDISWQFSGRGHAVSSEELLSLYETIDDVNLAPGAAWIYCNGGYLLVSVAIERITGRSLEEVLRERIFEPVGMHDTLLRRWDSDFLPNSATLHMTHPVQGFDRSYLGTALTGEGGIVSTVDDMLLWLSHMDRPVVGSSSSWSLLKTPQRLNNGTTTNYGLGLINGRHRGVDTLFHAGGVMGGNSQMLKVSAAGLDVAIMVNRGDILGVSFVDRILDACLPGLDPAAHPFTGPFATGTFCSPSTGRVVQLFARGEQQIVSIDGSDTPSSPDRSGALRPIGVLEFVKQAVTLCGDAQRPTAIRLNYFGTVDELARVEPPQHEDVAAVEGRYSSASTETQILISRQHGSARMMTIGRFGSTIYQLQALTEDVWRAKSINPAIRDGVICVDVASATLRFSNDRLWGLVFRKQS